MIPDKHSSREWLTLLSLGAEMFSLVAVAGVVGWFVDVEYRCSPFGLIFGLILGGAGAVQMFIRRVIKK
jgi:F0F1-type ATP synthase assembly protein I